MSGARSSSAAPEPSRPPRRPHRTWSQRVVLTTGCVVIAVCLGGISLGGYVLTSWSHVERIKDVSVTPVAAGEPMNVLVVGTDSRAGEAAAASAGISGQRSDTMMVIRVDPHSERVDLLSLPRDLVVPIAGTGRTALLNSAYNRSGGRQVLIDTIRQDFGIEINHWVEVDFAGFRQLVDGIGGVTLYFPYPIRDPDAAVSFMQTGCVTLGGERALQYARIRKVQYLRDGRWRRDPLSDLSRIARQHALMSEALKTGLVQARSNPLRLRRLVDIGTRNVGIDETMQLDDVLDLADRFRDFSTDRFVTRTIPTLERPGDRNHLIVDESAAEPVLNLFRGLDPGEVAPRSIVVSVLNGTVADPAQRREGLASDASGALAELGFRVTEPGDAPTVHPTSAIFYAPGELNRAQGLARYISGPIALHETPEVSSGHVTLVAGVDFTTVHEQPSPLDQLQTPAGGSPAPGAGGATPPTSAGPASSAQATTTLPSQIGAVPPGKCA
jgi:LCP family protein required for cell wall assembly